MKRFCARAILFAIVVASAPLLGAAPQSITFRPIPGQIYGSPAFTVTAQSSSGLPVSLASNTTAVCKIAAETLTLFGPGTCSLTASQSGNAVYSAAPSVRQSFVVSLAKPSAALTPTPGSPISVGGNAYSVIVADFNGDGIPDIGAANGGSGVTVLLGDGAGGFSIAPGRPVAVGNGPLRLVAGDFNGDGLTDLAVASTDAVTLLFGNGQGGFPSNIQIPLGPGAGAGGIAAGDFNGDGFLDLVVGDTANGTVITLLGNNRGGFVPRAGVPIAPGATYNGPFSFAVGDFNGDGIPDLATANQESGDITILQGDGLGGFVFSPAGALRSGSQPFSIVAGDFNGDGIPDLATADNGGNDVTVLLGNGAGGFSLAPGSPFAVISPWSMAVGDINGDGHTDMVAGTGAGVSVLLGDGTGRFSVIPGVPGATVTVSVALADFNGDGIVDLASANWGANSVSVLLGGLASTSLVLSTTVPATVGFDQSVPLTATVSEAGIQLSAPGGQMTFMDGAAVLGAGVHAANAWTFTAWGLAGGTHTFTARYVPDSQSVASTSNALTVYLGEPTPVTGTLIPSTWMPGGTAFTLTVNGMNFVPSSQVEWNLSPLTTKYVSATQLTAAVPNTTISTAAPANIVIASPGNVLSNPVSYASAAPSIVGLNPPAWVAGGAGLNLTVNGARFAQSAVVNGNGSPLTTTFVSATQITAAVPASLIASSGDVALTVLNPGGAVSSPFPWPAAAPTISSMTPAFAVVGGSNFNLCVTGTGFISGAEILWNFFPMPTTFVSSSSLCAPAPAALIAATEQATILVLNPDGDQSVAVLFLVSPPGPAISQGGVVPIYSSNNVIQPGAWVSIYGTNLATATTVWNGDFPTFLGGTSVAIDGKPAWLWSVSPGQINLQAPDDTAAGPVPVVVTTPLGTASSTVTLAAASPSFSLLPGVSYPAAVILTPDGSGAYGNGVYDLLGPTGAFSFNTRPVKAGETLLLYGTGFGPTNPAVPAGTAFNGAAPAITPATVMIGGLPANVLFCGLVGAGLYQITVVVPKAASGDQPLVAKTGAVQTQNGISVSVAP